ncbi:rod-binding protein [Roseicyclus sp.]|uniref:rod-binding protein n=1 Tax=Roseicyclus sp. TaxID=1914329 RepID=UPI003F6D3961
MTDAPSALPRTTLADLSIGRATGATGPGWGRPEIRTAGAGPAELRQAAEEFEAMFLNQFLQQARKSQLSDGLLTSSAGDTFQGMLDQEYSRAASGGVSLGIADALYAQFAQHLPRAGD